MARIRYSLSHPEGAANLAIYEDAVAIMKGEEPLPESVQSSAAIDVLDSDGDNIVDPDSPFSWENQADVHSSQCAHDTDHFFPWHRAAIYYFEEAVRATTGENDFTLPYWNYNDPDQRQLPIQFRDPTSSLHEGNRGNGWNNGISELSGNNLDEDSEIYRNPQSLSHFRSVVEGSPHGAVHGSIGGKMGFVDQSAEDPIFWLHHNNIDRLWAKYARYSMTPREFSEIIDSAGNRAADYTFTDINGESTGNIKSDPNAVLDLTHRSDVEYQDYDENGEEIVIPTNAKTSDFDFSTLNPCFFSPLKCQPIVAWRDLIRLPLLKIPDGLIELDHSEDRKTTKNEDFRSTLKITYSSEETIPGAIDVLYGDTQKRNKIGKGGKNAFPKTNQTYDELISKSPQFADKYYAGTIALFEHEPDISGKKGGHHTKDHITDGGLERTASFDITSLIKKQRNNPRINDQIFLNINPEQKYAAELANALNIESISVEHFTIPKGI